MIKLVVDNSKTPRFKILESLRALDGKECSLFHAVRKVPDFVKGVEELGRLVRDGVVERREAWTGPHSMPYFRLPPTIHFNDSFSVPKG